ncbi:hypothetical protein HU200_039599 [Digitaria exilis]|uniref:At1g61320/AtMIF1 LRR domain-containing protein n=1 Tax=Digitaria exilis TaxID=1010633 RepID=A0A835BAE9_9POAL|nr:hypothetical protein HU200_039599 [Digitaria exilis]
MPVRASRGLIRGFPRVGSREIRQDATAAVPQQTLRRLSLSRWRLHRIMGSGQGQALQLFISGCPQLVDITLEECPGVTTLTVASASLRRFAMVCCHNARHIRLESRALRSLRYKGGLPPVTGSSFIWIADHATVTALTIDICEGVHCKTPREITTVTELIARCTNLEFLHLSLRPAMAYNGSVFASSLRRLPRLRCLELKGSLHSEHSVRSVSVLLQNTPKLEELSLLPLRPDPPKNKARDLYDDLEDMYNERVSSDDDKKEVISCSGPVYVPHGVWTAPVRCFKHGLRRISLVGYRGRPFERMIARFLLSKAVALEELSVSLAPASYEHRVEIERELTSWRFNRRTRITFV